MWRLFRPREPFGCAQGKYRGQNKRHGFLKEYVEREELSKPLLFLLALLRKGLRGFQVRYPAA